MDRAQQQKTADRSIWRSAVPHQKQARGMKQSNQNEITALYYRLSQDDGADGASNSIQDQRNILERYAREHRPEAAGAGVRHRPLYLPGKAVHRHPGADTGAAAAVHPKDRGTRKGREVERARSADGGDLLQ